MDLLSLVLGSDVPKNLLLFRVSAIEGKIKPINIVMLVAAAPGVMVGRVLAYWTLKVLLMLCDWVGVLKP